MLPDLMQSLGTYLYEVFVVKFSWWAALGFAGQGVFFMRMLAQWVASERAGRSVMPFAFWLFSIGGGILLLIYSIHTKDPVFLAGQGLGLIIYVRNVFFVLRERREASAAAR